ncbi:MAG: FAD/NAD(P)-binding protein [Desulfobulbaceae bacterium]|nr:FAD/NAD(P)-binding protein [Desulfobulbaceae bacterium]
MTPGCGCGGNSYNNQQTEQQMTGNNADNPYLPRPARVVDVIVENSQIKTFVCEFSEATAQQSFSHQPGQFMMVSVPHCGEAPISIASTPTRPGVINLSVRRAGSLTEAMHKLEAGATIGLRGPYGNPFPLAEVKGRDLLFVAGGIGLAPLKSVIDHCLDSGHDGRIVILYGSRTPEDIAFKGELAAWEKMANVTSLLTVDSGGPGWQGAVGVVTTLLPQVDLDPAGSMAFVCGPPLMIRFVMAALSDMGYPADRIITTMERYMKCGVGVCGHCHMDDKLVCVDGPVFSLDQLRGLEITELR